MRSLLLMSILCCLGVERGYAAPSAMAPDLPALEQAWHGCAREAFARQPVYQGKLAAERNALDECKEHEDAYVTAILAAQIAAQEGQWQDETSLGSRAASWASYVAVYVVDPFSSWLRRWRH
jgi:hypothetical protein